MNFSLILRITTNKTFYIKTVRKVFDLLGLLSPFVVGTKILFQTLCKSKIDWDSILDGELWMCLTKEFEALSRITIPRCYTLLDQHNIVSQQLHGFSDALCSSCILVELSTKIDM